VLGNSILRIFFGSIHLQLLIMLRPQNNLLF
jgi:hypothetical protein